MPSVWPKAANGWRSSCSPARKFISLLTHRRAGGLDLRFHGIEVEARALLHRGELDGSLRQLCDLLLDKHKTPELVLEPTEVILGPVFGLIFRPTCAFEWIQTQVDQVGHVRV